LPSCIASLPAVVAGTAYRVVELEPLEPVPEPGYVPDDVPLGLVGLLVPLVPDPMPEPVVLSEPVPELPLLPGVDMPPVPGVVPDVAPGVGVLMVPFPVPLAPEVSLGAL
jgi:hypothetical protein